jgi:beta-glucuronidase
MLYPQNNCCRSVIDLSGIWKFKVDPKNIGESEKWYEGFETNIDIAVPGSWNEMLEEEGLLDYTGNGWFLTKSFIPNYFVDKKIWLRIGSADFHSKLWINGNYVGENNGGYLPFEFNISEYVEPGNQATIVLLVNNELTNETIPQGISSEDYEREGRFREETYPPARFDFSPNGGIHRPVKLHSTPKSYIDKIKVDTKVLPGHKGKAIIKIDFVDVENQNCQIKIIGNNSEIQKSTSVTDNSCVVEVDIDNCRYWSPTDPYLYKAEISITDGKQIIDQYNLRIGIREIKIDGNKFLLNGEEVYFKGFGKHEDFWVIGKGLFLPLIVKDFGVMKWINANSFRTSHYPYAEEIMQYADEKGFLVIDEVPAVSLDLRVSNQNTLNNHKDFLRKLIERDYNHPSVVMWAAGNEPNLVGAGEYYDGRAWDYWKEIFEYTKTLDETRPVTVPNCQRAGIDDPVFEFSDVLTINRYYGWYEHPGKLDKAIVYLEKEMDAIYEKYKKPIIMTEFGADTVTGMHSLSDQMFSEEYQTKLISMYIELFRRKDYVIGEHIWNFADFRTPMHFRRVLLNLKGVFTRDRQPKSVAFKLRDIWEN